MCIEPRYPLYSKGNEKISAKQSCMGPKLDSHLPFKFPRAGCSSHHDGNDEPIVSPGNPG